MSKTNRFIVISLFLSVIAIMISASIIILSLTHPVKVKSEFEIIECEVTHFTKDPPEDFDCDIK